MTEGGIMTQRDEHGRFVKADTNEWPRQDDIVDAEVIEEETQELAVIPPTELAIIEPVPWLVDDLLHEAIFEHREVDRIARSLELIKKLYPELEPPGWLADHLLREAASEHHDEAQILGVLELIESHYPEFHRKSGERRHFTVHDLGEDHRASLRTQFPSDLEEQIEARFHEAVEHVADRQKLYYQGLP